MSGTAIAEFCFKVVGFLASWGIDRLIAKWVAYFMIAWENYISDEARAKFNAAMDEIRQNMPEKAKTWDEWRKTPRPESSSDTSKPEIKP